MPQALTVPPSLVSLPCWFGLDLASVHDTVSVSAAWRDDTNRKVYCKNWFWLPEETAKAVAAKGKSHWITWAAANHLTLTPGPVVDFRIIKEAILTLAPMVKLREIAYDPWAAAGLASELITDGLPMVKVPQSLPFLSPAMKELERMLGAGELKHDNNPVMNWQIANVKVWSDMQGNIRPNKQANAEKIDGPAALITAVARLMVGGGSDIGLYGGTGIAIL